jgi:hypothetical protein
VAGPAKRAVAEKERRAHMVNRPRRKPVEQAKRVPKEKECRARSLGRNSNQVAHLQEPSAARDRGSRKVEKREHQKKRRHQGRDNLSRNYFGGSGMEIRSRFFVETPYSNSAIWTAFSAAPLSN